MEKYFNPNIVPGCLAVLMFIILIKSKSGWWWVLSALLALYIAIEKDGQHTG